MTNRVAVSLALPDTETCLKTLGQIGPDIGMAEIRVDMMDSCDLPRLIENSPCPLIITCRPQREGGRYVGSEDKRLDLLARAAQLGCAFVDVEWDSLDSFKQRRQSNKGLIVSRHWLDSMPETLLPTYETLMHQAEAVKLVGYAHCPADAEVTFKLMKYATTPLIAIAMGEAGQLTRLLAPCFANCLLTYGAISSEVVTAPGQLTLSEMIDIYRLHEVGVHTEVHLHLCLDSDIAYETNEKNRYVVDGESLHIGLIVSPAEAENFLPGILSWLPKLSLTVDPCLALMLPALFPDTPIN